MSSSPPNTVEVTQEPGAAMHHSAVTPQRIDWLLSSSCSLTLTTLTQYCSMSGKIIGSVAGRVACGLLSGELLGALLPAATTWIMPLLREASAIASKVAAMSGTPMSASWYSATSSGVRGA